MLCYVMLCSCKISRVDPLSMNCDDVASAWCIFRTPWVHPRVFFFFFDEAATVLKQYDLVSESKYTLRIHYSFFPHQK